MIVILKCKSPEGEQQLVLRPGQRGRVGSSEWVELSLPNSPLRPEHFGVDARGPVRLICSEDCLVTFDGKEISELDLKHGADFSVGHYEFSVVACGEPANLPQPTINTNLMDTTGHKPWWSAVDWEMVDCSQQVVQQLKRHTTLQAAIKQLLEWGQSTAGLRLLATSLPPTASVSWSLEAIENDVATGVAGDRSATVANVKAWLEQPDEQRRKQLSLDGELVSPADWIAQAVIWTGGSLAPDGVPAVAPPRSLYGVACATAVQLHLASGRSARTLEQTIDNGWKYVESELATSGQINV